MVIAEAKAGHSLAWPWMRLRPQRSLAMAMAKAKAGPRCQSPRWVTPKLGARRAQKEKLK